MPGKHAHPICVTHDGLGSKRRKAAYAVSREEPYYKQTPRNYNGIAVILSKYLKLDRKTTFVEVREVQSATFVLPLLVRNRKTLLVRTGKTS